MKKKVRKARTTQTVRVEVVAPQNGQAVQEHALVTTGTGGVILGDNVEQALERAQRKMYFRNQLLKLIAKQINPRDIYVYVLGVQCLKCNGVVKQGNTGPYCKRCGNRKPDEIEENLEPYLSGAGCRFVLSSAGAKFSNPEIIEKQYEGTEGPYIDFEVWVTVETADGRTVRTMGNNATDDDFFAKRWRYICPLCEEPTVLGYGQSCAVHGNVKAVRDAYYLSMQEVDIPAIKQKAMTNAWNHAVRDLGFMPNIQHLKEAGVNIGKLRRIEFGAKREEESNEFPAAASKHEQPGRAAKGESGSTPESGSKPAAQAKGGAQTPPKAAAQQPAAASNGQGKGQTPKKQESAPVSPPQARIPHKVVAVKKTKTGAGVEVELEGGKRLYCFDNRKMGEDGEKLFDVLLGAVGKEAIFLTAVNKTKDKREFTNIVGCVQLGEREWTDEGIPVLRRDPPSREPGEDEGLFS
jgi:hypothetical protein